MCLEYLAPLAHPFKGFLSGAVTCCMVCLEGTPFSRIRTSPANAASSGKTSLIHSLAGELGLDIYVVSLSSKG
jgi:hypothetical protein